MDTNWRNWWALDPNFQLMPRMVALRHAIAGDPVAETFVHLQLLHPQDAVELHAKTGLENIRKWCRDWQNAIRDW